METSELLDLLVRAASSGNWYFVLSALLVAAVWAARKYLSPKIPFLGGDVGGILLAFAMAFFGAVASALGAGAPISMPLFVAAAKIAFTAMGGYTALKKLVGPALANLPLPGKWGAASRAAKAGIDAVEKSPAGGADAVTGTPRDVP